MPYLKLEGQVTIKFKSEIPAFKEGDFIECQTAEGLGRLNNADFSDLNEEERIEIIGEILSETIEKEYKDLKVEVVEKWNHS